MHKRGFVTAGASTCVDVFCRLMSAVLLCFYSRFAAAIRAHHCATGIHLDGDGGCAAAPAAAAAAAYPPHPDTRPRRSPHLKGIF